ncbi:MAG: S8 family serine peptidase [Polyangiales bacterium]
MPHAATSYGILLSLCATCACSAASDADAHDGNFQPGQLETAAQVSPPAAGGGVPIVQKPLSLDNCRFSNEGGKPAAVDRDDFQDLQGYLKPASQLGIDAQYAWTIPGGTGKNVTVADIEYATWNLDHEDLRGTRICFAQNGAGKPFDFTDDHGSGVIGVMVSNKNDFGMTGVAHDASLLVVNHANDRQGFGAALASAVAEATKRLNPGDVILIEANTDGQRGVVEHLRPVYDAIVKAVAAGVIVLETAGNGNANLDNVQTFGDSGAIWVGGGTSARNKTPLAAMNLNYGARIDLQGWGQNVATLGRGRLNGNHTAACNNLTAAGGDRSNVNAPACSDVSYRDEFSGTSSAGPIVASAAAVISSIAQERGYLLSSREVRDLLKKTGTPQGGAKTRNIGPLPNLRAAIDAMRP